MKAPDSAHWLTITDLAKELGKSRATIQRAIAAGEIPASRIGAQYVIPLRAWEQCRAGTWAPPEKPEPLAAPEMIRRRKVS